MCGSWKVEVPRIFIDASGNSSNISDTRESMENNQELWEKIRKLGCREVSPVRPFPGLFLLKISDNQPDKEATCWLIGMYKHLRAFATEIRTDESLQKFLSDNHVRIGLRSTDVPPAGIERQQNQGAPVRGANSGNTQVIFRSSPKQIPVQPHELEKTNRDTDDWENKKRYWASQTPESHHIVEFNNLETIGVSRESGAGAMDYEQLPAVLLAAEFHKRYISRILDPTHLPNTRNEQKKAGFTKQKKEELEKQLPKIYHHLYVERSPSDTKLLKPLWFISREILKCAASKNSVLAENLRPFLTNPAS
jgi:hypothetical protein